MARSGQVVARDGGEEAREKRWSSVYVNGELGQVAKRSSVCGFDEDGFVGCDE